MPQSCYEFVVYAEQLYCVYFELLFQMQILQNLTQTQKTQL